MAILKSRLPLLMSLVGLMIVVGLTLFIQPGSSTIFADEPPTHPATSCNGHQACIDSTVTVGGEITGVNLAPPAGLRPKG